MELANKKSVKNILEKKGFAFKKSLGQNFLVDSTVAPKMAECSADKNTGVLEIGPGAGVLTRELSRRAKKVVAIELDESLRPILRDTLKDCENAEVIFGDVLKTDLKAVFRERFSGCERITVCANLPYYITSPVIMKLLESELPIERVTVMVQKEAADRICAKVGSRAAGAVTAAINYYAQAEPLFFVPKNSFLPEPKVDSEVINLKIRTMPPVEVADREFFFRIVNACFMLRRKTAVNSISNAMNIDKKTVKQVLSELGINETARGETFDMKTLAAISGELKKCLQKR